MSRITTRATAPHPNGPARWFVLAALASACGASPPRPGPREAARSDAHVVRWLRDEGAELARAEPGRGTEDLDAVVRAIGDARIVGLGEATHGTREFFQLKHRVFELAVTKLGFTVFAIEAGATECREIDRYVKTGEGDVRGVLRTVPIWNTEEVVALIEWMRDWNDDPAHVRKLEFVGVDMQTPYFAIRGVESYLARVTDPLRPPPPILRGLEALRGDASGLTLADWDRILKIVDGIPAAFEANRDAWIQITGDAAYVAARHDVTVMQQAARNYRAAASDEPDRASPIREQAMADNAAWELARRPADTRMVLWAHNGHVSLARSDEDPTGYHLRQRLGSAYVALGFVFGEGAFRVPELRAGRAVLVEHVLPAATPHEVAAPFVATGRPLLFADLRRAPAAVAAWFRTERPMREAGGTYTPGDDLGWPVELAHRFDMVMFVARMTGTRPLE